MNDRPAQLISTALSGGPSAWDAKAEEGMATWTCLRTPASNFQTRALGFLIPNGSPPLNMLLARPSQKLRKLNAALITVGVLRPVTCRVLVPLMLNPEPPWNTSSGTLAQTSAAPVRLISVKGAPKTPLEPTTSFMSESCGP